MLTLRKTIYYTVVFVIVSLLLAACLDYTGYFSQSPEYPSIHLAEGADINGPFNYTYPFQNNTITITAGVNPSVYWGAIQGNKSAVISRGTADECWVPDYYRSFISDPNQDELYNALAGEFRSVRSELLLDDDEYCELITLFVQHLPYKTNNKLVEPRYPVETFVEGNGDCDDKSMLLAGLLSGEGYNVSLIYFGDNNHMAVGIKSPGRQYMNTGYAFIEPTNITLIGIPPERFGNGTKITSEPLIIPIGSGTKMYTCCNETTHILRHSEELLSKIKSMHIRLDEWSNELAERKEEIDSLREELRETGRSGSAAEYHNHVQAFNRLVDNYNSDFKQYRSFCNECNECGQFYNRIMNRPYDRKGVYREIASRNSSRHILSESPDSPILC